MWCDVFIISQCFAVFWQGKVLSSGIWFNTQSLFCYSVAAKTSLVLFGLNRFFFANKNFCCGKAKILSSMWRNILYLDRSIQRSKFHDESVVSYVKMFTSLDRIKCYKRFHDESVVSYVHKFELNFIQGFMIKEWFRIFTSFNIFVIGGFMIKVCFRMFTKCE